MVKGVNKTVIEINDTGNELFEKIILYVSPRYSGMSALKIRNAAAKELGKINGDIKTDKKSLRQMMNIRRKRRRLITVAALLGIAVTAVIFMMVILI